MKTIQSKSFYLFSIVAALFTCFAFFPAILPAAGVAAKWATIPATFTCADLLVSQGKAEAIWADNAENAEYMPNSETVQAIVANQTAKLDAITGLQDKNNTIKITWLTTCDLEVDDCSTECFPDGAEVQSNCKNYVPTICKEVNFKITEATLRDSIYSKEEVLARAMLKAIKKIEDTLGAAGVAFLEDVEGVNAFMGDYGTLTGGGVVGNSATKIAPSNWTASLLGYFIQASKMNLFGSPYLLSGNNLYQAYWNAQAEFANADGKGGLNKFNQMKPTFDLWNIDSAFSNNSTFLIDRSAVAFGGKWQYPEQVTDFGGDIGKRYSIPSKTIPGLRYDVHYLMSCVNKDIVHKFNIIAKAGFYLNPTGCTENNTHVLRFEKLA